jgi:hypothetical protein
MARAKSLPPSRTGFNVRNGWKADARRLRFITGHGQIRDLSSLYLSHPTQADCDKQQHDERDYNGENETAAAIGFALFGFQPHDQRLTTGETKSAVSL